jgi:hypothetical protein
MALLSLKSPTRMPVAFQVRCCFISRTHATRLEIASQELPWSFDADGTLFRLVSEAYRISLAYLFDPHIAVHTSLIEPLPHQITAVYETMLDQPTHDGGRCR